MPRKHASIACHTWFIWRLQRHINYLIYAVFDLLMAPQLLYGINTAKRDKKDKDSLYQDDVTAPLDWAFDDDTAGQGDEDEEDGDGEEVDTSQVLKEVLSAIEKVCHALFSLATSLSHLIPASQNHPCHSIKSPATPSMVCQSHTFAQSNGTCITHHSSHPYFGCQDMVVFDSPNASYVTMLLSYCFQFLRLSIHNQDVLSTTELPLTTLLPRTKNSDHMSSATRIGMLSLWSRDG